MMLDARTCHGDVVVASLRSSINELERLLTTITSDDAVVDQDFTTQLKDVEHNIRILRKKMQERRLLS